MDDTVKKASAVIALIMAMAAMLVGLDNQYARAAAVKRLELRLDQKMLADRQDKIQERIWKLEDRYPSQEVARPQDKEQWRKLEKEFADNEKELDIIRDQQKAVK
jgi:hypothetical protein